MRTPHATAEHTYVVPIMPSVEDPLPETVTTTKEFGPFEPGEHVIVGCDGVVHLGAIRKGEGVVKITTSRHKVPLGIWRFVVPRVPGAESEGVYVGIIGAAAGTIAWVVRTLDRAGTVR